MKLVKFFQVDWLLLFPVVWITIIGILTLTSFNVANVRLVTDTLVVRHTIFVVIGLLSALVVAHFDFRLLHGLSRKIFWITIVLLIAVLIVGTSIKGSTRWIYVGSLGFQPSEFAKAATIVLVAKYISTYHRAVTTRFRSTLFSGFPIFLFVSLILFQPDLGSALILLFLWFGMIVFGGIRVIHVFSLFAMGIVTAIISWTFFLQPYQQQRVLTFLNPLADPLGSGYNTVQAMRAISSGGLIGRGVGTGSQYVYVPEVHNDFIFSGFAQEWGFVGISVYFILLVWIFTRLYFITKSAADIFSKLLVIGVSLLLLLQTTINIGMNLALVPVTGTPLPFMSYGGSAMVSFFILIGLVLSIQKHKQAEGTIHMRDSYDMWG